MNSREALFRDFLRVEWGWFSQVVGWWKVSWEALRAVGCMFLVQLLSPPFGKVRNFHITCLQVLGCTHILSPNTSVHVAQPLHGGIVPSRRCAGEEPCWELHLVGQYCPWGILLQDKSLFMLVLVLFMLALSCFLGRGPNNDHGHLWCQGSPSYVLGGRSPLSSEEGAVDMLWECCPPCFVLFGLLLVLLGTVLEQEAEAQHTLLWRPQR